MRVVSSVAWSCVAGCGRCSSPTSSVQRRNGHVLVTRRPMSCVAADDATVARAALDASGEVVKGTGDGAMVVFDGAAGALAAAVSIQQGIELWNRGRDEVLVLRVGLALGDLEAERGDLHGIAANEAARLCAIAGPGEIVTSDLVRLVAGSRTDCELVNQRVPRTEGLPDAGDRLDRRLEPVAADAARTHVYALACARTVGSAHDFAVSRNGPTLRQSAA